MFSLASDMNLGVIKGIVYHILLFGSLKRVFNHLKAKMEVGREAGTGCDGGGQYRSFANHLAHLTAHLSTPSPAVVGGRGRWCSGRR